ncbi:hypothetical protein [Pseudomonas sp. Marseille-QA0332]
MTLPSTATLSLEEFLAKMSEKPWTFGWDAILVFDRQKTNMLLMQEYIDRFDADAYFPPIEPSEIDIAEGIKHALIGLVLDKPRLSFENANISDSRARLTLRMVGGKQMQLTEALRDGKPVKTPTRLSTLNAVVGPSLLMNINLLAVPGSVDSAGKVMLDLAQGYDYYFTGVETEYEREKVGVHLKGILEHWQDDLTQFELSELKKSEQSLLEPGNFGIRTHLAPGGNVLDGPAYGEGAVVLFVAMKGSQNGSYPAANEDMVYMLPSGPRTYSSNLVLGSKFILEKVVLPALDDVNWIPGAKLELRAQPGTPRDQLVATAGIHTYEAWEHTLGILTVALPAMSMDFVSEEPLSFYVENDHLIFRWKTQPKSYEIDINYLNTDYNPPNLIRTKAQVDVLQDVLCRFSFKIERVEEQHRIRFELSEAKMDSSLTLTSWDKRIHGTKLEMARSILDTAQARFRYFTDSLLDPLKAVSATLDAFRLNNLLFRGENTVVPQALHWPTDLTILGDLAPDRTSLEISPAEVVVSGGRTQHFKVEPAGSVQWSVENIPGESGDTGTIDANGAYQAPSAASLRADGFRRVVVKATRGAMISKALVSLVENEVSVYPSVVVVGLGSSHSLVAGTADGAALEWSLGADGLGSLGDDPNKDPEMQDGRRYTAPNRLPEPKPGDPLAYFASRLDQVTVTPKAGGTPRTIDVLIAGNQSGSYWLEASAQGANAVKLTFYRATRSSPKDEVPAADTHWHLFKGDGTLSNGVYTPAVDSAEQYAIVLAFYDDGESSDRYAYMIVPVPFVSTRHFIQLLSTPVSEV